LRRFAQSRVDNFRAGVAERQRNDFGANVVAIKARFGDQNSFSGKTQV
jgi:hypothetical protein